MQVQWSGRCPPGAATSSAVATASDRCHRSGMSRQPLPRTTGASIATVERPGAGPSLSAPVEPVTRGRVTRLVGGGVLIYGGLVVVGLIITRALAGSTLISDEASIS